MDADANGIHVRVRTYDDSFAGADGISMTDISFFAAFDGSFAEWIYMVDVKCFATNEAGVRSIVTK